VAEFNGGHCSWFWDKVFGVDISLYCYDHDAAYRVGDFVLKLKSDVRLAVSIFGASNRADNVFKELGVQAVAVGAYIGVSTLGIGFWAIHKINSLGEVG
jgi:hypothetical protein